MQQHEKQTAAAIVKNALVKNGPSTFAKLATLTGLPAHELSDALLTMALTGRAAVRTIYIAA